MTDEAILILHFVDRIRRHFGSFGGYLSADETEFVAAERGRRNACANSSIEFLPSAFLIPAARATPTRSVPAPVAVLLAAGGFIHLVIENNVSEIFWPHARDCRQRAKIHQQRAIAVERDHLAVRQSQRHAESDRRAQAPTCGHENCRRLDEARSTPTSWLRRN